MSEENTNIPRFIGESTNSVDSKGRIFVPTKWRSQLNETMILHAGFGRSASGRYLELTTVDNFNKLISMINALPPSEKRFESLKRVIFRNSEEVSADKQGRILIPKRLIEHACLKSEIKTRVGRRWLTPFIVLSFIKLNAYVCGNLRLSDP